MHSTSVRGPSPTTLYARNGQAVAFARLAGEDRLLRHSAIAACLAWGNRRHTRLELSAPALKWLSRARLASCRHGILPTPPPALAMELDNFAHVWCAPRLARAARRTLADQLRVDTFVDTWRQALRHDPEPAGLDASCLAWSLQHYEVLVQAGVFTRLEHEDPEAHRAWVRAALECMAHATPADWRRCEAVFVGTLRDAMRLGVPYNHVALPEPRQVADDDLRAYRRWVLDHPVWHDVPKAGRHWTAGEALSRNDYILHQLSLGVGSAVFTDLVKQLSMDDSVRERLYDVLPTYAARGDITALRRVIEHMPTDAQRRLDTDKRACEAAIKADRDGTLQALLQAVGDTQAQHLLATYGAKWSLSAATHSPGCTLFLAAVRQTAGFSVDPEALVGAAMGSWGRDNHDAAKIVLDQLRADGTDVAALIAKTRALHGPLYHGRAPMVRLALSYAAGPQQACDMLLPYVASTGHPSPWDTPEQIEALHRDSLALLLELLPLFAAVDLATFERSIAPALARLAATRGDLDATLALLTARPEPAWTARCTEITLEAWLAHGSGLAGARAILARVPPAQSAVWMAERAVFLATAAVKGGDVAALRWFIETAAPAGSARHALYKAAFNNGASLLESAKHGHVAMVRYWLQDHAGGAYAEAAVTYGDHVMLERAADANQGEILDMVVAFLRKAGTLDKVMDGERGANAISFAIQGRHHAMVRRLLALPLTDDTRWGILAADNSPLGWANRGDTVSLAALVAWAPATFRQRMYDTGMTSAVIQACTYKHLAIARFAMRTGSEAAQRHMLSVHQGAVVTSAAREGDVILLESACRLVPSATHRR